MNSLETIRHQRAALADGAKKHEQDMVRFLRDLIAIPAESS